jgi:hypothetical protein
MTDKNGNGYQEMKSFVIDSHAPKLSVKISDKPIKAGEDLIVNVSADSDTVHLSARIYGAQPVRLSWSQQDQTNVGKLRVPANLAAGRYTLTVSAEDAAHNQSTAEVTVEVISR